MDGWSSRARVASEAFGNVVCDAFGLSVLQSMRPLAGSSNLLWRLQTTTGDHVVKELPLHGVDQLRAAAGFEAAARQAGVVPTAQPQPDSIGGVCPSSAWVGGCRGRGRGSGPPLPGRPAGAAAGERRHRRSRWAEPGQDSVLRCDDATARLAGFAVAPDRSRAVGAVLATVDHARARPDATRAALERVSRLARAALQRAAPEIMSHLDHKPENCLLVADELVVLDWDEAGLCDPRLEAVESAARWAWTGSTGPDTVTFAAFVDGYHAAGRRLPKLVETDWGKWLSGVGSWAEFQAQRSLADPQDNAIDPAGAAGAAVQAVLDAPDTLPRLRQWCAAINDHR